MIIEDIPDSEKSYQKTKKQKFLESLKSILPAKKKDIVSPIHETIAEIVSNDDIQHNDSQIIMNVANMTNYRVEEIMIPRSYIVALNIKESFNKAKDLIIKTGFIRIPLYQDSLDNIRGFLHVKDVLANTDKRKKVKLEQVMQRPLFIPAAMKLIDLLHKMHSSKIHVAIVVDEYGGTDGMVTLADLTAKIIGELESENFEDVSENNFTVNANIKIEEVEEKLKTKLINGDQYDFDTLAGYLGFICGYIPKKGEVIKHESGIKFTIKDAEPRFVKKVLIEI